jgi:hypothetical protein
MPFPSLVIALGTMLASALIEVTTSGILDPVVATAKDTLAKKLKLGKYEAIDRAVHGAYADVLAQCTTEAQRNVVQTVLSAVVGSDATPFITEFSQQIVYRYLLPAPNLVAIQPLTRLYRQLSGPAAVVRGEVPDEQVLNSLFETYFVAFRERLLREEDFQHLREYFQLIEHRQQTSLQTNMVELLEALVANTAHSIEDFAQARQAYLDSIVHDLKDHTIRGFSPQVGSRVLSLSLAEIFLPLQAVERRPALAEYAEEDLLRQAVNQVPSELDWQRRSNDLRNVWQRLAMGGPLLCHGADPP